MRGLLRVASVSIPLIGSMQPSLAAGLTEKMGKLVDNINAGNRGGVATQGVFAIIDGKKIYDGTKALTTYNEIKSKGVPTYADKDEALKATRMLSALGGAEFAEPVRQIGSSLGRQEIDSANFQNCFIRHDNACLAQQGARIDATTKSVNERTDQQWSSWGATQTTTESQEQNIGWFSQAFSDLVDYLMSQSISWQEIRSGMAGECNISIHAENWQSYFLSSTAGWVEDTKCTQQTAKNSEPGVFEFYDLCVPVTNGRPVQGSQIILRTKVKKVDNDRFFVRQHMRTMTSSFDSGYVDADSYDVAQCKG